MSPRLLGRVRSTISAARDQFPSRARIARSVLLAGLGMRSMGWPSAVPGEQHWYGVVRTFTAEELIDGQPRTTACAIAVVCDGDYSAFHFFSRPHEGTSGRRREATLGLVGVDAFEYLYKIVEGHERDIVVYLHQPHLRDLLRSAAPAFPQCTMRESLEDERLARLNGIAGTQIDMRVHRQQARLAGIPRKEHGRLMIATDASLRSRHRGAGIACVSEEGIAESAFRAHLGRIDVAELAAIDLALSTFCDGRALHILVDSRHALNYLQGTGKVRDRAIASLVDSIRGKSRSRSVTFEWVRAHNGQPLNETAHRLAVAARRCHTSNVPADTQQRIVSGILEDLTANSVDQTV
ncbi:RNase H family protein [Lolliginicoccus suaedae]|uniref:RNase H family protein n=1 Tax=Lolliginicoccus suaedae TaxID=2605429 RepID=UPI0011F0539E|nr:RNase H family protein [Lolliginicoccus suaedae]